MSKLLITLILISAINSSSKCQGRPEAIRGVLDLSKHKDISSIDLLGEWYFSWQQFEQNIFTQKKATFSDVPGTWDSYTSNISANNTGYCTYGLKIILPKKQEWALHLPTIHSAYNLYVDGKLLKKSGEISKDLRMIPAANTDLVYFSNTSQLVLLTIYVSNFHFSSGGIWAPLSLGQPQIMSAKREQKIAVSSFLLGSLVIMAIYHFILYIIRRTDRSPLYFSLICISIALRESFAGEALFYSVLSSIGYEFSIKILYLTFPISLVSLVLYFKCIYPFYSRLIKNTFVIFCTLYCILIFSTNNIVYGRSLTYLSALFFIQCIYLFFVIISQFKAKIYQNILMIIGILALVITICNDILFEAGIVNTFFSLPVGFFMFVLLQSILLAVRFSDAFQRTETLSVELSQSESAYVQAVKNQKYAEEMVIIEEMKNRFFSNITHEFKTPLSLIISPIEKLRSDKMDDSEFTHSINTIYRSAKNLLNLINQLLDLSKLEAGMMRVSYNQGSPFQFLTNIANPFRDAAEQKNIRFNLYLNELPDELVFDSEKLDRIVSNLLSNSLKFTRPDGAISLSASFNQNNLYISVQDDGVGIPSEIQPYIFDRFYQGDTSSTRLFGGTGIGLALVKELLQIVGGTIHVENASGAGVVFQLVFPATAPYLNLTYPPPISCVIKDHIAVTTLDNISSSLTDENLTILLVEDNQELLEYIQSELSKSYRVITASNGNDAWHSCVKELPDLVISDVMMPGMDGFDLCKNIKQTDATDHIGVILLTAKGSHENRIAGLRLGANDYLPKPFNQQELLLRISNFLNHKLRLKQHYSQQLSQISKSIDNNNSELDNPFLNKLYAFIDQFIDDSDLSVGQIASALAVSERTLHRKLTSLIGMSTSEVVRAYRISKSVGFLQEGMSISEVAYRVGFESPSYFGQCFKEAFRVSPSEFLTNKPRM